MYLIDLVVHNPPWCFTFLHTVSFETKSLTNCENELVPRLTVPPKVNPVAKERGLVPSTFLHEGYLASFVVNGQMAVDLRPYGRLPALALWCFWGTCFYSFVAYQMYGERGKRSRVRAPSNAVQFFLFYILGCTVCLPLVVDSRSRGFALFLIRTLLSTQFTCSSRLLVMHVN